MTKQAVCLAGTTNIGKTGWLLLMAEKNPDIPFYLLDTQNRAHSVASGVTLDGKIPPNVVLCAVDEEAEAHPMVQCLEFMTKTVKPATNEDHTIAYAVDMVGKVWEWAQDYYVFTKTGKRQEELDAKPNKTDFNVGIDDSHSWSRIKGWHNTIVYSPINSPQFNNCHVLLTTGLRDQRLDTKNPIADKDSDMTTMWQHFGRVLPDAEKHLTYEVYTMLAQDFVMLEGMKRKQRLTLVKDMKRGRADHVEFFRKEAMDEDEDGMWDVWGTYNRLRNIENTDLEDLT